MNSLCLHLTVIFRIFTISEQRSELETVLEAITAEEDTKNTGNLPFRRELLDQVGNYRDSYIQTPYFPRDRNTAYHRQLEYDLENDLEQALRFESDRICRVTGRCGCRGGRCNSYRIGRSFDDFVHVDNSHDSHKQEKSENQMEDELEYDRMCRATGRCGCRGGRCQKLYRTGDKTADLIKLESIPILLLRLRKGKNQRHLEDNWQTFELESNRICRATGRCGCTGGRCGKAFRTEDQNIDIKSVLHDPDIENDRNPMDQMSENNLEQALRFESDRICRETGRCGCSGGRCGKPHTAIESTVDDVEKILLKLDSELNKQNRDLVRTGDNTLEDNNKKHMHEIQGYGDKGRIDNRGLEYDERCQASSDGHEEYLDQTLKSKKYKLNNDLDVILLDEPNSKRYARKNTYERLPVRSNDGVPTLGKKEKQRIRKRIFPLTLHQKQRKLRNVRNKIIPKFVWRRNMQEQPKYGIPFELEVQGLGQVD